MGTSIVPLGTPKVHIRVFLGDLKGTKNQLIRCSKNRPSHEPKVKFYNHFGFICCKWWGIRKKINQIGQVWSLIGTIYLKGRSRQPTYMHKWPFSLPYTNVRAYKPPQNLQRPYLAYNQARIHTQLDQGP